MYKINQKRSAQPWRMKHKIDFYIKLIEKKDGTCLSKDFIVDYNNKNERWLKVCCGQNHIWKIRLSHLKKGIWCPQCTPSKKSKKFYFKKLKQIAKQRGCKLLSKTYINSNTGYLWQCSYNHIFVARSSSILAGKWCSYCNLKLLSENICREYLSAIFNHPFKKIKLKKIAKTNLLLEFDGYGEKVKVAPNQYLNIAMEHNGRQHYDKNYTINVHKNKLTIYEKNKKFEDQIRRDLLKKEFCKQHMIRLIIIPDLRTITKIKNLKSFIHSELIRLYIPIPKKFDQIKIPFGKCYQPETVKQFARIQSICKKNTGFCLDPCYINNATKMKFKCKKSHSWESTPASILKGSWCPDCANIKKGGTKFRYNLQDCIALAFQNKGHCLSKNYRHVKSPMKWKCSRGQIGRAHV